MNAEEFIEDECTSSDMLNISRIMERYANYKTKELQTEILGFRQLLINMSTYGNKTLDNPIIPALTLFDKHFRITLQKQGHI